MGVEEATRKKAMLLHYVGEEVCDIFDTLTIQTSESDTNVYQTAVKALADYFEPEKCVDYHVYNFRKEFYTRLQLIARKCEFSYSDLEIKRQLIQGTVSARLRRKAIEQSLTLDQILKNARAMEAAEEQTIQIEKEQSNAVQYRVHTITQNLYLKLNVAPNVVCVVDRTRTKDSLRRKEDVV